ncbi:MAG: hypothetical protein ACI3Z8_01645 [Paludibacteraceae bacterium]
MLKTHICPFFEEREREGSAEEVGKHVIQNSLQKQENQDKLANKFAHIKKK